MDNEGPLVADLRAAIVAFAAQFPTEVVRQHASAMIDNLECYARPRIPVANTPGVAPTPASGVPPNKEVKP